MIDKLSAMPTEIVELIGTELAADDDRGSLLALRLVCRNLHQKTFQCVCQTFFTAVQTDLSRDSLHRLKVLSEKSHLSHHTRTLVINNSRRPLGEGFIWRRDYCGTLLAPMSGMDILRAILLEGLVKCRSFHIHMNDRLYYQGHDYDAITVLFSIIADETSLPVESFHLLIDTSGGCYMNKDSLDRLQGEPQFRKGWGSSSRAPLGAT